MTEMQMARQEYADMGPAEKEMFQAIMSLTIALLKIKREPQNISANAPPIEAEQPA